MILAYSLCFMKDLDLIVQECQSFSQIHSCSSLIQIFAARILLEILSRTTILQDWTLQSFVSYFFYALGTGIYVLLKDCKGYVRLCANIISLVFYLKSAVIVTPRLCQQFDDLYPLKFN